MSGVVDVVIWPELVGSPATEAVAQIQHDRPDVAVPVLPPGAAVTPPEFNPLRVCVFIDNDGNVAQVPIIG